MPKRTDIHKILVIGSGPIVIGQACEFDYSGTQGVRVLGEEGYEVVLVNSNPATIMTDPELAVATYIEPLTPEILEAIVRKERPCAILPTLGGQTALNLAFLLSAQGILDELGVELIGANASAIQCAEDRQQFKQAMSEIGLCTPKSAIAHSFEEALAASYDIGYPIMIRPSFILGGAGTGIAYNKEEFERLIRIGLDASPISEVLIETSLLGWKEFELEVMRDKADNCVVVCSIENFDPMGVHTGDSITVAPAQTLSDVEYQTMRDAAFAVIRRVGVETGGSNIQFALSQHDGQMMVIEMNPRVSRSSALASKATGFPIAKIAARLAVGYRLDEITNDITGATPACFEPTIDYVVTKIPRWAFEKLPGTSSHLGTSMRSVGEVMAIGRTFCESLQKAVRSLEQGRFGLNCDPLERFYDQLTVKELMDKISVPTPERIYEIETLLRKKVDISELARVSGIDRWFLDQISKISKMRAYLSQVGLDNLLPEDFRKAKRLGFSDAQLAWMFGAEESQVHKKRVGFGIKPTFLMVDTCAAEFDATTPYYYSSFEDQDEVAPSSKDRVLILGSGPNRIGQGVEFDYCCCHASMALQEAGYETIMLNCNPETVSTDYDISDRLYFEPIFQEETMAVIEAEKRASRHRGRFLGVIVSLGGQTPLKLASQLPPELILGTPIASIDLAEDRERFHDVCETLGIPQPQGAVATKLDEAFKVARKIGYPVLVRPSYVLGGRAMAIIYDDDDLETAIKSMTENYDGLAREGMLSSTRPVLIDKFLEDAIEVDVDALRDKTGKVFIGGIMEHVEQAGVHSGDSACAIPPQTLSLEVINLIKRYTRMMADSLDILGLINIQYAVKNGEVFVLEANPRASRTVPFVSKATGVPLAKIAARVMLGATFEQLAQEKMLPFVWDKDLDESGYEPKAGKYVCVKEAVLPFRRFPEMDSLLGPEMRSTGEVMGIDLNFGVGFAKSQMASGNSLPSSGIVVMSLADRDKQPSLEVAKGLLSLGFSLAATSGTAEFFNNNGVTVETYLSKIGDTNSDMVDTVDLIASSKVTLVINTPRGRGPHADGAHIRSVAGLNKVPCLTTIAAAKAAVDGIRKLREGPLNVKSIQEYYLDYNAST